MWETGCGPEEALLIKTHKDTHTNHSAHTDHNAHTNHNAHMANVYTMYINNV